MFKKIKRELCLLFSIHSWEELCGTQDGHYRICRNTGEFQKYSVDLDRWIVVYQKPVLKPIMYDGIVIDYEVVESKVIDNKIK